MFVQNALSRPDLTSDDVQVLNDLLNGKAHLRARIVNDEGSHDYDGCGDSNSPDGHRYYDLQEMRDEILYDLYPDEDWNDPEAEANAELLLYVDYPGPTSSGHSRGDWHYHLGSLLSEQADPIVLDLLGLTRTA